jgi:formyltetrahydrofolate-dependent phosphoribosylglycinamide formyltransferase
MPESLGVAVLASGSGTNLQALLDRFNDNPEANARVTRVIASRPGIGAIARAERHGVPASVMPQDAPAADWILAELGAGEADLIVLAGWLKLIPEDVVRAYRGRMLNIHPALLPAFGGEGMYGRRVHEAVIRSGARITGVTVHFVDEIYDHGAIIAQWPVPVMEGDDAQSLAARVLRTEHRVLPSVVHMFAAGAFRLGPDGGVEWSVRWFDGQAFELTDVNTVEE